MQNTRVLIIDDDLDMCRYLDLLLSDSFSVEYATESSQVSRIMNQFYPDLILLDIILPEQSGIDLCARIRASALYSDIPIILMTASRDERYVEEGLAAGAVDFIRKPFSAIELKARMRSALLLREEMQKLKSAHRRLQRAFDEIKTLKGLIPICSHCHNVRDDKGYWNYLLEYISENADVQFSHGICPACLRLYYEGLNLDEQRLIQKEETVNSWGE
jgi:CheY-like chemotaxis protein